MSVIISADRVETKPRKEKKTAEKPAEKATEKKAKK